MNFDIITIFCQFYNRSEGVPPWRDDRARLYSQKQYLSVANLPARLDFVVLKKRFRF